MKEDGTGAVEDGVEREVIKPQGSARKDSGQLKQSL